MDYRPKMIIDTLDNATRYYTLHPGFKTAFEYLSSIDLNELEPGTIDVAAGVKIIVAEGEARTAEAAVKTFECHNQNIDIQLLISGAETMGWKPRKDCSNVQGDGYNEANDILFFEEMADTFFTLNPGHFVIFYPEDVHAPMIGEGLIKKLVVKVTI